MPYTRVRLKIEKYFQTKMFLAFSIVMSPNEKPLIQGFLMTGIKIALWRA